MYENLWIEKKFYLNVWEHRAWLLTCLQNNFETLKEKLCRLCMTVKMTLENFVREISSDQIFYFYWIAKSIQER